MQEFYVCVSTSPTRGSVEPSSSACRRTASRRPRRASVSKEFERRGCPRVSPLSRSRGGGAFARRRAEAPREEGAGESVDRESDAHIVHSSCDSSKTLYLCYTCVQFKCDGNAEEPSGVHASEKTSLVTEIASTMSPEYSSFPSFLSVSVA